MPIVQVLLDVPIPKLFDYWSEEASSQDRGFRVLVSFGRQKKVGIIWAVHASSTYPQEKIKPIEALWRDIPAFSEFDWSLLQFASQYYHYPLGQVALGALPPAFRKLAGWSATIRKKIDPNTAIEPNSLLTLNLEQQKALKCITEKSGFQTFLLHGVTGSGKTEVYLRATRWALDLGRQVLILVPEINLTPQLEARFKAVLGAQSVVALHSSVPEKERAKRWLKAQSGEAKVVLGTRLAIFCPMPHLGLIVVDEEHDLSYKQMDGLRYHARDLAVKRAHLSDIPIVLGSATPSLESWWQSERGKYIRLSLTQRAHPEAQISSVDLVRTTKKGGEMTDIVLQALEQNLAKGQQSLVFINRRGFAPVLYCADCAWCAPCHACSTRLVIHRRAGKLRCHSCGHQEPIPQYCAHCHSQNLQALGDGTQRIEEQLRERWPSARIARIDRDTVGNPKVWQAICTQMKTGQLDILVGTQILAKGHDFEGLTLIVGLQLDGALYSTDFRASEHLFAQILQVSGRAGRGQSVGKVLIQTQFPDHPLYVDSVRHDYAMFAKSLLEERKTLGLPPFCYQMMLKAQSKNQEALVKFMEQALIQGKRVKNATIQLFDPVPPVLSRQAGLYRYQLLVQSKNRAELQKFAILWVEGLWNIKGSIHWCLDRDPMCE
jgi:primosomal protein N' (replication factor Y)